MGFWMGAGRIIKGNRVELLFVERIGKFENNHFKDLRILGFILIFLIVCGIILEIIASNDGCGYGDGGGLGCLGYGFAWLGCLFFVGLTILLSIISYLLAIKKSEVENTVKSIHIDPESTEIIIDSEAHIQTTEIIPFSSVKFAIGAGIPVAMFAIPLLFAIITIPWNYSSYDGTTDNNIYKLYSFFSMLATCGFITGMITSLYLIVSKSKSNPGLSWGGVAAIPTMIFLLVIGIMIAS
jgi:hypothetical protein